MKPLFSLSVIVFFVCSTLSAQEIDAPAFGNGLFNLKGKDSTWAMKIGMRFQFLGMAQWEKDNGNLADGESNFLIRRARLKFDGFAYSPRLTYKVELGLSNNDLSGASKFTSNAPRYILDAVVKWNFYENFELWFGQTKLPGNRERLISSANMQFVDRSQLNSSFNIDRDVGVQIKHQTKLFNNFWIKEAFAISQGEGRNITSGNLGGFQYTSRLEVLPFGNFVKNGDYIGGDIYREETPKLSLAATYDFNNNAVKTRSNQGSYMATDLGFYETNITTLFVDAMFKFQGVSLMLEYAKRTAEDPLAKNSDDTLTGDVVNEGEGVNVQTGYVFNNNWEVSLRYTFTEFEKSLQENNFDNQYTLGMSKYIVGHKLKVQSDVSYSTNNASPNQLMWRLQFDIHF